MNTKPKIIHFQRKPHLGNFSLEFIFQDVRNRLKDRFDIKKLEAKYVSKGLFKRLFIVLNANYYQGDVNHVTGDINFLTLGLKKEKTILTILDCGFVANHTGLKFHILKYFWLKLPLLKTALITTISEASKQEILKYVDYPKENIRVIPVAISPGFKFLEAIPFNKSKPSFLHIGMAPNKNLIRVTEALIDLSAHYIIIGKLKPEYIEALDKNNISYENHFNLTEEELVQIYHKSDALIFASTYEGFGMPILEAQAMGKPVITANISSMPEVAGDAACFVDPLDVSSIRQGILKVIEDDEFRNEIIQKGFENVKRFDADRIANLYADVYDEIISSQKVSKKTGIESTPLKTVNLFVTKHPVVHCSIEKLFIGIFSHLNKQETFNVKLKTLPYDNKNLIKKLANMWFAWKNRSDINHITVDIHFLAFALPSKNTILTIHDCGTVLRLKGLKLLVFTLLWLKWPCIRVKYISVISEKTKQDVIKLTGVNPKKIHIVPNYIHERFTPQAFPTGIEYPNILHVGTARHKNWLRLAQIRNNYPGKVTIIGRLKEEEIRYLEIENLNYINKFDLTEEELMEEYRNTHLVYFASTFEGFGMPILEAQAMGRPVITSNISPMKEVAGFNAALVNPYVQSEIKNIMMNILLDEDERNRLIAQGYENVKRFRPEVVAEQYMKLYKLIDN